MGVYAVTGSASGMGKAVVTRLQQDDHTVIGVDIKDAEVQADLSAATARSHAAGEVLRRAGGKLDGAVFAAGLGPVAGREKLIAQVNYHGVVDLLTAWRPALAAAGGAHVVVYSSNSTTTVPAVPRAVVKAFLANRPELAVKISALMGKRAYPAMVYAGSKIALSHWVRRHAVSAEWAGAGIRLNALAPGAILTPMLEQQLADPATAGAIETFPIPIGEYGRPEDLAEWTVFMMSAHSDFLCGSVVFVDGGTDAYFRPNDWPNALGLLRLPQYLRKMKRFVPPSR